MFQHSEIFLLIQVIDNHLTVLDQVLKIKLFLCGFVEKIFKKYCNLRHSDWRFQLFDCLKSSPRNTNCKWETPCKVQQVFSFILKKFSRIRSWDVFLEKNKIEFHQLRSIMTSSNIQEIQWINKDSVFSYLG